MADQLQLRRGTTAQIAAFTGAQGEVIVDTDKDTLVVHDGATAGGFPLASESAVVDGTFYFNDDVSVGSIANSYILSPKANTNIPTSYMDGQQFGFVTANANTGPSTATFSALGVRSLKWPGGIDPVAGEISGRVYLIFDAANNWFEIQDIERSFDYLNTVRANVSSTATVDLVTAAPNTRHINITGTTTITGFTIDAGDCYFVRFNAALTLTNGAGLVTQSGANITTAAGDTCILRATADNVVEILSYAEPYGKYVSPEQTITSGGRLTLAHGIGTPPEQVQLEAICKIAELGWTVGQSIIIPPQAGGFASTNCGLSVAKDASNLVIQYGSTASVLLACNAAGYVLGLTNANWRIIVRAWV